MIKKALLVFMILFSNSSLASGEDCYFEDATSEVLQNARAIYCEKKNNEVYVQLCQELVCRTDLKNVTKSDDHCENSPAVPFGNVEPTPNYPNYVHAFLTNDRKLIDQYIERTDRRFLNLKSNNKKNIIPRCEELYSPKPF